MAKVSCLRCWVPVEYRDSAGKSALPAHETPAGLRCVPEVGRVFVREHEPTKRLLCIGASEDESKLVVQGAGSPRTFDREKLIPWVPVVVDLQSLGTLACHKFTSIEPDWAPPQMAMFHCARSDFQEVFVDDESEQAWIGNWEQRFDAAELDDEIELWTPAGSIYFLWTDCRVLSIDEIQTDKPHWVGLTMDRAGDESWLVRRIKSGDRLGTISLADNGFYCWKHETGDESGPVHPEVYDAYDDFCRRFNRVDDR